MTLLLNWDETKQKYTYQKLVTIFLTLNVTLFSLKKLDLRTFVFLDEETAIILFSFSENAT